MEKPRSGGRLSKAVVVLSVVLVAVVIVLGFYPKLFRSLFVGVPEEIVGSFLSGVSSGSRSAGSLWSGYLDLVGVKRENRNLKKELLLLSRQLSRSRDLFWENAQLKSLIGLKGRVTNPGKPCRVMAINPTTGHRTFLLNCGSVDGIEDKSGVVGSRGVLGYVIRVFPNFCQVLWVEDTYFALEGHIPGIPDMGVIHGQGVASPLRLKYLPILVSVKKGDLVRTTGEDGIFPPDVPIGTVLSVGEREKMLFRRIDVAPSEQLETISFAYVFAPMHHWVSSPIVGGEPTK